MRTVLLTGSTGFVGSAAKPVLAAAGWTVVEGTRGALGDLGPDTAWERHLDGVDAVVHLAAVAHRFDASPESFRRVNAGATESLAKACAKRRVRVVFLSSIKAADASDPYGASKRAGEQALTTAGGDFCALRAPLVYGPGVKANFLALMRAVDRGLPLPLSWVRNRRSLVYVETLADALARACAPGGPRGVFGVCDGEDLSTPDLVPRLARAMKKPARLWPLPPALLRAAAALTGHSARAEGLLSDAVLDGAPFRSALGWVPPFSVDEALDRTARWYYSSSSR